MDAETTALRDHFAGQALTGILTTPLEGEAGPVLVASLAYEYADAMLVERHKEVEKAYQERVARAQLAHKNEEVRKKAEEDRTKVIEAAVITGPIRGGDGNDDERRAGNQN